MKKFLFSIAILFTTTSAFAQFQLEGILGFHVGPQGISFQVVSGGCTSKDDFQLSRQQARTQRGDSLMRVGLLRTGKPDFCEAFYPYGIEISYTWAELGLAQGSTFVIDNKLRPLIVR